MEKLTDSEIVKALEICSDKLIVSCPDDCPFYDECEKDLYVLKRQALDLINRKDAEIERLKEELDGETVKNMRLGHEVERLQAENTDLKKAIETMTNEHIKWGFEAKKRIENAKYEAYKEFAERLHQKCKKYPYTLPSVFTNIEITYKELTEGGNEDGMD